MAVDTDQFTATDLAARIPEKWSPVVLRSVYAKSTAANFFKDVSEFATGDGDTIHIGEWFTNGFTAQTQSTQGAEITTAGPAMGDISLAINTHEYVAFIMGDKDIKQLINNPSVGAMAAEKAGHTLRISLEDALYGLWSGLTTNTIGDTATVLSDAEVRQAIEALASADFDVDSDIGWHIHPYVWFNQLLAVQKYYDASQAGNRSSLTIEGNFGPMDASRGLRGNLYGIPVFISSRVISGLQTYRNLLAKREAFAFAVQTQPNAGRVRVQSSYELAYLGLLTVADIIYGVVETRDAAAVLVNASSSFIGS